MMLPALFGGFANWLIPAMIGTDDMIFKRLNWLAFLLFPAGFILLLAALFLTSSQKDTALLLILALYFIVFSLALSAINFIATILVARAPFMKLRAMPPFVWSILVASFLMIVSLPVMSAALTFNLGNWAWRAGDTALPDWSNLPVMMWFFTHPELFVLMLPAFGIISEIIANFSRGQLAMATMLKCAFVVMGGIGFILWGETALTGGNGLRYQNYFLLAITVFTLPIGVIMLSWLATLWRGAMIGKLPMLWVLGFMSMLLVACLSAISLGISQPLEIDAFVGHFHYLVGLSGVFAIFAGWYFWFGKISSYEIRPLSGKLHFWTFFVCVHLTFLPQHFGKATYAPHSWGAWIEENIGFSTITTAGACLAAMSLLLFFYALIEAFVRKRPVSTNPWGTQISGLEWTLPLPLAEGAIVVPLRIKSQS